MKKKAWFGLIVETLKDWEQPQWAFVLRGMLSQFQDYPFVEANDEPVRELAQVLADYVVEEKDVATLAASIAVVVDDLRCWHYRATAHQGDGRVVYWNPLHESWVSFRDSPSHTNVKAYQGAEPNPAADVIQNWVLTQLL